MEEGIIIPRQRKYTKEKVDRSGGAARAPHLVAVLTKVVQEFLAQLDYTQMAFFADMKDIEERHEDIQKAFAVYCASQLRKVPNVVIDNPLWRYVYVADVYKDSYDIMWEYIGEVEHQFGLNYTKKDHPYKTNSIMWIEDFYLAYHEYFHTS